MVGINILFWLETTISHFKPKGKPKKKTHTKCNIHILHIYIYIYDDDENFIHPDNIMF